MAIAPDENRAAASQPTLVWLARTGDKTTADRSSLHKKIPRQKRGIFYLEQATLVASTDSGGDGLSRKTGHDGVVIRR
ncbi:hypothetical protein, partial [Aeromonas hydrophila]|uniref:hypothetical protein n=1 Tax=Aeromonas hydrophila TaxID=644 RepID=UPI003EC8A740